MTKTEEKKLEGIIHQLGSLQSKLENRINKMKPCDERDRISNVLAGVENALCELGFAMEERDHE